VWDERDERKARLIPHSNPQYLTLSDGAHYQASLQPNTTFMHSSVDVIVSSLEIRAHITKTKTKNNLNDHETKKMFDVFIIIRLARIPLHLSYSIPA